MATKTHKPLKKAHKVFQHYFMVLCETEIMNDPELRNEFIVALDTIKQTYKNQKGK